MTKEKEFLQHQEEVVMVYLAEVRVTNTQFQLDQKLGLGSKEEEEIFNLFLVKRLLENKILSTNANQQSNPYFSQETDFLGEDMSLVEKKIEKLREQIDPERAEIIDRAVNDLNNQAKNESPENANASLLQPTEEMLAFWGKRWRLN